MSLSSSTSPRNGAASTRRHHSPSSWIREFTRKTGQSKRRERYCGKTPTGCTNYRLRHSCDFQGIGQMRKPVLFAFSLIAVSFLCVFALTQRATETFDYQQVMIPMRDGVHLQTVILTPRNATTPLPILFRRTP